MTQRLFIMPLILILFKLSSAQTIIQIQNPQNPLFEVSADEVTLAFTEPGMTLGADLVIAGGSGQYSYLWTDAQGQQLGQEPTLYIETAGEYQLTLEDTCQCQLTVDFHIGTGGISSACLDNLRVYPNPTTGPINIIGGYQVTQVSVFNLSGSMVDFNNSYGIGHIDLSGHPSGTYLLHIVTADGDVATRKIILK